MLDDDPIAVVTEAVEGVGTPQLQPDPDPQSQPQVETVAGENEGGGEAAGSPSLAELMGEDEAAAAGPPWPWDPRAFDDPEWRGLFDWVAWVRRAYGCERSIPPCWFKHEGLTHELAALYQLWVEVYDGAGATPAHAVSWHERFAAFLTRAEDPRRGHAGCTADRHMERPVPPQDQSEREFEEWLLAGGGLSVGWHGGWSAP